MRKRIAGTCLLALLCLTATACFSIEQEIFLNQDGSGELVMHVAMPDLPEDMLKSDQSTKNPAEGIGKMKQDFLASLPPTVKVKELKEVRSNGSLGFYMVFQFKDVKDLQPIFDSFNKGGLSSDQIQGKSQWSADLKRTSNLTTYTGRVLVDVSDKKPAPVTDGQQTGDDKTAKAEQAGASADMSEQLKPLLLGSVRLRFVLHAPAPITDSNADIILNQNTAVWNCSLIAFMKNKNPIEMRASYRSAQ